MSFQTEKDDKFRVVEVDLEEENLGPTQEMVEFDEPQPPVGTKEHRKWLKHKRKAEMEAEKPKYGWAFFLTSMFIGLGITATTGNPFGLFGGMGIGFLFFVPPIYNKVMGLLKGF